MSKKIELTKTAEEIIDKLEYIAQDFADAEGKLQAEKVVWNFLCVNFNGYPLVNLGEMLDEVTKVIENPSLAYPMLVELLEYLNKRA